MDRRTFPILLVGAVLIASAPLLSRYGYIFSRNQFVAKHGELWLHEHIYFGSRWELFALLSLFAGIGFLVLGLVIRYRKPQP